MKKTLYIKKHRYKKQSIDDLKKRKVKNMMNKKKRNFNSYYTGSIMKKRKV